MNLYKAIFAFALCLLSLLPISGFCAESKGFLEKKESGVIDWTKGIVTIISENKNFLISMYSYILVLTY